MSMQLDKFHKFRLQRHDLSNVLRILFNNRSQIIDTWPNERTNTDKNDQEYNRNYDEHLAQDEFN